MRENLLNAEFRKLALTFCLFGFAQAMGFVFTLYYNNVLNLTAGQLSLLPPLAAVAGLLLYRLVVPRLHRKSLILSAGRNWLSLINSSQSTVSSASSTTIDSFATNSAFERALQAAR